MDKVLGSDLFEEGLETEVYETLESDSLAYEVENKTEIKLSEAFKFEILDRIGIKRENSKFVEEFCNLLQQEIKNKTIFWNFGGNVGFNTVLCFFLVFLKHNG